jgi:hypothetical protein
LDNAVLIALQGLTPGCFKNSFGKSPEALYRLACHNLPALLMGDEEIRRPSLTISCLKTWVHDRVTQWWCGAKPGRVAQLIFEAKTLEEVKSIPDMEADAVVASVDGVVLQSDRVLPTEEPAMGRVLRLEDGPHKRTYVADLNIGLLGNEYEHFAQSVSTAAKAMNARLFVPGRGSGKSTAPDKIKPKMRGFVKTLCKHVFSADKLAAYCTQISIIDLDKPRSWPEARFENAMGNITAPGFRLPTEVSGQIKQEMTQRNEKKGPRPRPITNMGDEVTLIMLHVVRIYEKALFDYFKQSHVKGDHPTTRVAYLRHNFNLFDENTHREHGRHIDYVEGDGTAWDSCQTFLKEFLEKPLMEHIATCCAHMIPQAVRDGIDQQIAPGAWRIAMKHIAHGVRSRLQVAYDEKPRFSGERGTSSLNWLGNLALFCFVYSASNPCAPIVTYNRATGTAKRCHNNVDKACMFAFEGDDSLLAGLDIAEDFENGGKERCEELGFPDFKTKLVHGDGVVTFVGHQLVVSDGYMSMPFKELIRALDKYRFSFQAAKELIEGREDIARNTFAVSAYARSLACLGCSELSTFLLEVGDTIRDRRTKQFHKSDHKLIRELEIQTGLSKSDMDLESVRSAAEEALLDSEPLGFDNFQIVLRDGGMEDSVIEGLWQALNDPVNACARINPSGWGCAVKPLTV